uniref:Ribosomal modification protein rimK-like family member A n=1 Tax=Hucho hucho TaxID=62062 RepID=A0A4W5KD33_9TELE
MCSRVWFVTDRRIHQEYPQVQILRALKQRCSEEDVEFRSLLMDQIVLTISEGQLGLRVEQEVVTSYPQVAVVRVPTPWVQSDSDITVLRHLEKMGCRLVNRPQAILNCVNKFWTFQELAGHGVPLPDTFSYGEILSLVILFLIPELRKSSVLRAVLMNLVYPCIAYMPIMLLNALELV